MKKEYDFSQAVRGKFYRRGAEFRLPIYLKSAMRRKLERLAKSKKQPVADLVEQLLKKDLAALKAQHRRRGAA